MIERVLQLDHPASQGHFPGNPIIPGAVLLDVTLQAIEAGLDAGPAPFRIRSAKFPHPARPGDRILIRYTRTPGGEIRFTCAVGETPVLTGQVTWHAPSIAE